MTDMSMADYERLVDEATADWIKAKDDLDRAQEAIRVAAQKLDEAQLAFDAKVHAKTKGAPPQSAWGKTAVSQPTFPSYQARVKSLPPADIRRIGVSAVEKGV